VRRVPPHVRDNIEPAPTSILNTHPSLGLSIDIMFLSQMPFLITCTRRLKFGTVEASSDRQLLTITKALETVLRVHQHRGFGIHTIFADPEFEPLRPTFPALDTCGTDGHVLDIERCIRTAKDRT